MTFLNNIPGGSQVLFSHDMDYFKNFSEGKPKNRTHGARGGKANLRWRCLEEGMNEEALPSPFTTLLQIDSASAAATEIIAALCHSHPQGKERRRHPRR